MIGALGMLHSEPVLKRNDGSLFWGVLEDGKWVETPSEKIRPYQACIIIGDPAAALRGRTPMPTCALYEGGAYGAISALVLLDPFSVSDAISLTPSAGTAESAPRLGRWERQALV